MIMMCPDMEKPVSVDPTRLEEFIGQCSAHVIRKGADMPGFFAEEPSPDRTLYEVYELDTTGNMKLAITVMKPGKVDGEYHMTKGHFHEDEAAGETYHCLRGNGMLLLQTKDGQTNEIELLPGSIAYIPPGWAHRTVNIGDDDLILLAIYPESAGHDYGAIEKEGFLKRVIEVDGKAEVVSK